MSVTFDASRDAHQKGVILNKEGFMKSKYAQEKSLVGVHSTRGQTLDKLNSTLHLSFKRPKP